MRWIIAVVVAAFSAAAFAYPHCTLPRRRPAPSPLAHFIRPFTFTIVYTMSANCKGCHTLIQELKYLRDDVLKTHDALIEVVVATDGDLPIDDVSIEKSGSLFKELGMKNGHILVFDSCRRLTYEVVLPYSLMVSSVVRAAVLSAYYGRPCGACPVWLLHTHDSLQLPSSDSSSSSLKTEVKDEVEGSLKKPQTPNERGGIEQGPWEDADEDILLSSEELSMTWREAPAVHQDSLKRIEEPQAWWEEELLKRVEGESSEEEEEGVELQSHYRQLEDWLLHLGPH